MNFFKSHFWYTKSQRNGILFLIFIILVLQLVYVFADFSIFNNFQSEVFDMNKYQEQIDSLKELNNQNKKLKLYPFNPNYLTDYKAYTLGMQVEEIDRLLAFREKGSFVNSALEFQKITKISDSLLSVISPYFKFPDWVVEKRKNKPKPNSIKSISSGISSNDINLVSSKDLQTINGVTEKLAKRIVAYRNTLHGFSINEQLYEVYYLKKDLADIILQKYRVLKKPEIVKLDINSATFKEVLHLPYIDYQLTKRIFNYRDEIGEFSSLLELQKIDSFPLEKYDRIALYLTTH